MVDHDNDGMGRFAAFLLRNRRVVGGLTAFAVAFSYVAANAMWYQPHAHGNAFFETRPHVMPPVEAAGDELAAAGQETIIRLEREEVPQSRAAPGAAVPQSQAVDIAAPVRRGDPVVEEVQRILAALNLYEGDVDGLTGPQTRAAIENYRRVVGLSASAEIDDQLLAQLGAAPRAQSGAAPLPAGSPGTDMIETSSATPRDDVMVMRIQAGLRAFGNEGIEIDGKVGSRTRAAIREFQSLFGLPETGEPDAQTYAKMRDIGLTD